MSIQKITPQEFLIFEDMNSTSSKNEWVFCIDPKFYKYRVNLEEFFKKEVYPTYRLNNSGTTLTGDYEDKSAIPITFTHLKEKPELLETLIKEGYVSDNDSVLSYHCESCGVHVIKDGIHRLSKWLVDNEKKEITVYEVASCDWSASRVDMPNFCKCINET